MAHRRTGFLVNDAEEMADAISECDSILPQTCRDEAEQKFSSARMFAEYLDLYRTAMSSEVRGATRSGLEHELRIQNPRSYPDTAELRAIADEWRGLYSRCPGATPFQHPEWVISWAETFSPERIRVVEVRSGSMLVGLAPFLIYPRGEERVLAFMAGGVSDYLDLLVDPQYENAKSCERSSRRFRELDSWTTLDLTDLPANSVLHRTHAGTSWPLRMISARACQFLQPAKNYCNISPSGSARICVRPTRESKEPAARLVEVATPETLTEFLEDLFRLHASRWGRAGQPGVLADEKVKAFHRQIHARIACATAFFAFIVCD